MDNSSRIKEHECPACGGSLVFVPEKGKLVCEYCGTEFEIKDEVKEEPADSGTGAAAASQTGADTSAPVDGSPADASPAEESAPAGPEIEGFDFTQFYENARIPSGESLPIYSCKSCGAEVIAPAEEASLTCPYCTNKIVLTDKVSGDIRPDGIIPFKIPQKELKKHLDRFYKDKKLLPKNFFSESKMEKVTGVYVPFWLFSGKLSGEFSYTGHTTSTSTEGNYEVTTTKNYSVKRLAEAGFADIPIDASDKLDNNLMDSVLPYDMGDLKNFSFDYLAGFTADRFDVPGKRLQARADALMKKTVRTMVDASLSREYSNFDLRSSSMNVGNVKVRYVLFPLYKFDIKLGKKKYHFAINGQTGKVVGLLPTDKGVSRMYFLLRFGLTAGIAMAGFILAYLMGGAM